jgi:alanyl-tRNA synthetase
MDFDERGYLTDPYVTDFSSRIRAVEEAAGGATAVYLDRTYFYPVSGGQPDDRGTLGGVSVVEVTENEKGVRHVIDGRLEAGDEVEGHIDWLRRFDHMQQHSGQHMLSRAFLELLGARTIGFHLGDETCTIDLDAGAVTGEKIVEVEESVNGLVWKSVPIGDRVVSRDEYGKLCEDEKTGRGGDMRSRLPDGVERVRIVEVRDFDRSTCCGTHCRSTGEIGVIKILGTEKVKGGTRIEFICGGRALGDYRSKHELLGSLSLRFSTDWRELDKIVDKLSAEHKALRKAYDEQSRELASLKADEFAEPTGRAGEFDLVRRIFDDADAGALRDIAFKIRDAGGAVVLFGVSRPKPALLFACSPEVPLDMGAVMKECAKVMGARGGGGKDFAQGGGGDGGRVGDALDEAERMVKEALE